MTGPSIPSARLCRDCPSVVYAQKAQRCLPCQQARQRRLKRMRTAPTADIGVHVNSLANLKRGITRHKPEDAAVIEAQLAKLDAERRRRRSL